MPNGMLEHRTFNCPTIKEVYPLCVFIFRTGANATNYLAFRSHKKFFVRLMGMTVPFFLTDLPAARHAVPLKFFLRLLDGFDVLVLRAMRQKKDTERC